MAQTKETNARVFRAYDLNGLKIEVSATSERSSTFLDPLLSPLACATPSKPDWRIVSTSTNEIRQPCQGYCTFKGLTPEQLQASITSDGLEHTLTVTDHCAITSRRRSRQTDVRFVPGKEAALSGTPSCWLLDDVLAANDRYLVHGGLLANPRTGRAIAIFAPSGTGKTTAVLALARGGLHFSADDALVLDTATAVTLWGVPRALHVHRKTAALLPWLQAASDEMWAQDERWIEYNTMAKAVRLAPSHSYIAELLVILRPPNPNDHLITPISKPEALAAIAADNVRLAPGSIDADNAATLRALTNLVSATRVIALSLGPSIDNFPLHLLEA